MESWHGTTILGVRKNGKAVIAGDGQVSLAIDGDQAQCAARCAASGDGNR